MLQYTEPGLNDGSILRIISTSSDEKSKDTCGQKYGMSIYLQLAKTLERKSNCICRLYQQQSRKIQFIEETGEANL